MSEGGGRGPPKFSDLATCLMCIHYIRASYNIECGIHIAVSCHVFYPSVAWYCPEWKEIESMPYFTRDLLRALSILRWEYTQKYQVNLYLFMDYVNKIDNQLLFFLIERINFNFKYILSHLDANSPNKSVQSENFTRNLLRALSMLRWDYTSRFRIFFRLLVSRWREVYSFWGIWGPLV